MKTRNPSNLQPASPGIRRSEVGSAVLIVLAVLALMTILAMASTRVTYHLREELRMVEKRQAQHWANVASNLPPANALTHAAAIQP